MNRRGEAFAVLPTERELALRWWMLPIGSMLPLSSGASYRLRFAGHPGGPCGPDVQDAVLVVGVGDDIRVGDVEFHVRASDWFVHRHQEDPRYNRVVLHVVLVIDSVAATMREDGTIVPQCSLYDLASSSADPPIALREGTRWPCQRVVAQLSDVECGGYLQRAGMLRFEQKTALFVEQLHDSTCSHASTSDVDHYDYVMLPALAEGLGYGRDRAFFRAAGLRLVGHANVLPEPLGRSPWPAPLDSGRLRALGDLVDCYRVPGIWRTLRRQLLPETLGSAESVLRALRTLFCSSGLSQARTDILLCNSVYPFAAAVGLLEQNVYLHTWSQELYRAHPGLASNRITRMMCRQLGLRGEPSGSCQQQGLQYIYQQTCREKHCSICMMGRNIL